jgi:hypothetical protein
MFTDRQEVKIVYSLRDGRLRFRQLEACAALDVYGEWVYIVRAAEMPYTTASPPVGFGFGRQRGRGRALAPEEDRRMFLRCQGLIAQR